MPDFLAESLMEVGSRPLLVERLPGLGPLGRLLASICELGSLVHEDWVASKRDWTAPGFRAIAVHRFGTWVADKRDGIVQSLLLILYRVMYRYVRNHYGIEIPLTTRIGRRPHIVHQSGIVFHGNADVGDDCWIRHNTSIGAGYPAKKNLALGPFLGNRVKVGPGAVIFIGVKIGDDVIIGPNAVVMSDVPAGARVFVDAPRVIQLTRTSPSTAGTEK